MSDSRGPCLVARTVKTFDCRPRTRITSSWRSRGVSSPSYSALCPSIFSISGSRKATAAFMVLKNEADKDTALVKVDNPASRITELHTHINDGGVMKMRPVKSIEIKAKGEAALKPGGFHVMMIELKAGMKDGDTVPLTLQFADGSSKKVDAKVRKPGAEPAPAMDHSQHKH